MGVQHTSTSRLVVLKVSIGLANQTVHRQKHPTNMVKLMLALKGRLWSYSWYHCMASRFIVMTTRVALGSISSSTPQPLTSLTLLLCLLVSAYQSQSASLLYPSPDRHQPHDQDASTCVSGEAADTQSEQVQPATQHTTALRRAITSHHISHVCKTACASNRRQFTLH